MSHVRFKSYRSSALPADARMLLDHAEQTVGLPFGSMAVALHTTRIVKSGSSCMKWHGDRWVYWQCVHHEGGGAEWTVTYTGPVLNGNYEIHVCDQVGCPSGVVRHRCNNCGIVIDADTPHVKNLSKFHKLNNGCTDRRVHLAFSEEAVKT